MKKKFKMEFNLAINNLMPFIIAIGLLALFYKIFKKQLTSSWDYITDSFSEESVVEDLVLAD